MRGFSQPLARVASPNDQNSDRGIETSMPCHWHWLRNASPNDQNSDRGIETKRVR